MGTWGTAIKDSDAFADIYSEFFDLYNKGGQPDNISQKITIENWEMLEIEEEKHSFWFGSCTCSMGNGRAMNTSTAASPTVIGNFTGPLQTQSNT